MADKFYSVESGSKAVDGCAKSAATPLNARKTVSDLYGAPAVSDNHEPAGNVKADGVAGSMASPKGDPHGGSKAKDIKR